MISPEVSEEIRQRLEDYPHSPVKDWTPKPLAPRKIFIPAEKNVRWFKPEEITAWFMSTRLGSAIERMANAMHIATDYRPEPLLPLVVDPPELDAPLEGRLITMLPETPQLPLIQRDPKLWARNMLIGTNAWEVVEHQWGAIADSDACSIILDILIEDTSNSCATLPSFYSGILPELGQFITNKVAELKDMRPADKYRKFASSLRWARDKANSIFADFILTEIMEESTLPFGEMEAPTWIDGYTGQVDAKIDFVTEPKSIQTPELPNSTVARLKTDLGYSDELVAQYLKAQETFNSSADDEIEYNDDYDTRSMSWDEDQEAVTPDLQVIRCDYQAYCQEMRRLAEHEGEFLDKKDLFLNFLQHQADRGARVVDLAGFFVQKQSSWDQVLHDWEHERERIIRFNAMVKPKLRQRVPNKPPSVLTDEDAQTILCQAQSLDDIIEFYDIGIGDGGIDRSGGDEDYAGVDLFSQTTLKLIKDKCPPDGKLAQKVVDSIIAENPEYKQHDVYHHPAFVEAFLMAMIEGDIVTEKDDDGAWSNLAVEAGWEAWRGQWPLANQAYHMAIHAGQPRTAAMTAFWAIKNACKITGFTSLGLQLSSGRFVNWRIAELKLKQNEIAISPDDRSALKQELIKRQWGNSLVSAL